MVISWNNMRKFGLVSLAASGLILGLNACDLNQTPYTTPNKIQIEEGKFYKEVSLASVDDSMISRVANKYNYDGAGTLELTITYPPTTSRASAQKQADEVVVALRRAGTRNVSLSIIPVADPRGALAIFSFTTYSAIAPDDCTRMPGSNGDETKLDRDYKIGCENKTMMARQVAKPRDLEGREVDMGDADGQRLGVVVNGYRDGKPNDALDEETASGN